MRDDSRMTEFSRIKWERARELKKAGAFMERVFGFDRFRPGQEEILESIFGNSDTLIIMPTGGGKSLCYQLPAFIRPGITLVISPLISLMKDQVDGLRVLDLPAVAVHSLMSRKEQEGSLNQIVSGETKLAYISPERLRNPGFLRALKRARISMVALDEAHCISQWGHDFRPDYLKIGHALGIMGRPQIIALTATATEKVRTDIVKHLKMRSPRVFITGFDRRNLFWEVVPVGSDGEKLEMIKKRLRPVTGGAITYAGTRKAVEQIVEACRQDGLKLEAYHAGMDKGDRTRVQEDFMEGRADLVVATNAFGMGIDRADIRMVIHHSFPGSMEAYYQESGRAGRDGDDATCLLLYSPADRRLQEFFIEVRYPSRETIYTVYDRIRKRPEDLLWLTYREIGMLGEEKIKDMAVASSVRILEEAGAVMRVPHMDNQGELYFRKKPADILGTLPPAAKVRRTLILSLSRTYKEEELAEGIRFLPRDLAVKSRITDESLKRALSEMKARGEVDYIPPFRGRGLRVLKRVRPDDLEIDFETLQLRRASDMEKLDQVVAYATTTRCRRHFLLRYFGEDFKVSGCGACDLCLRGHETGTEARDEKTDPLLAIKLLSGVARLKGRFGVQMAAKVLWGSRDRMIFQFGLHRLSTYGLLSDYTLAQIQAWLKELLAIGFFVSRRTVMGKRIYRVLELSEGGFRAMRGEEEVRLSPAPEEESPVTVPPIQGQGEERAVFERLRELRSAIAKEERLPPYCIFQDRTLREMARKDPSNANELLGIAGVGEVTLRKYGNRFLRLLNEIRKEASR